VTKMGSNFFFGLGFYFHWSSDFCPRMAKGGVCQFVIGHILLDKIISL
jgi:hypothetical protein